MEKHRDPSRSTWILCPHCESQLNKKTYQAHKRLYFDQDSHVWMKKRCVRPTASAQGEFDIVSEDEGMEESKHSQITDEDNESAPVSVMDAFDTDDDFSLDDKDGNYFNTELQCK